jgi:hypothetical protein
LCSRSIYTLLHPTSCPRRKLRERNRLRTQTGLSTTGSLFDNLDIGLKDIATTATVAGDSGESSTGKKLGTAEPARVKVKQGSLLLSLAPFLASSLAFSYLDHQDHHLSYHKN